MTKEKLMQISDTERLTVQVLWKSYGHYEEYWPGLREQILHCINEMDKAVEVYNMENGKKEV